MGVWGIIPILDTPAVDTLNKMCYSMRVRNGMWESLVIRFIWDEETASSNLAIPTIYPLTKAKKSLAGIFIYTPGGGVFR